MRGFTILLLAGLIAFTGCSATAAPEATPSESVPVFPETYRSVVELKEAFVRAGGDCPEWKQTNQVQTASESGTCSTSNVLSVYISEAQKDAAFQAYKSLGTKDASLLVGKNWIINDKNVKSLDPAIGGTFYTN